MPVFYSPEDKGYIVHLDSLPNISAFGETEAAALKELEEVRKMYVEVLEEDYRDGEA